MKVWDTCACKWICLFAFLLKPVLGPAQRHQKSINITYWMKFVKSGAWTELEERESFRLRRRAVGAAPVITHISFKLHLPCRRVLIRRKVRNWGHVPSATGGRAHRQLEQVKSSNYSSLHSTFFHIISNTEKNTAIWGALIPRNPYFECSVSRVSRE